MKFGHVDQLNDVTFNLPAIGIKTKNLISSFSNKELPSFYFGAPGWSDVKFKGLIYPPKTPPKKFLNAYAQQFNSIEVNATRYGTPKMNVLDNWMSQVGDGFKFSMKVPQVISHRKDINDKDSRYRTDQFLSAVFHLGSYSGICFAVMANYFRANQMKELENFISFWPEDVPLAIEFRDKSWFENNVFEEVQDLLKQYGVIPVVTDTPGRRDVVHFNITNDQLFVRYVGDFAHASDLDRTAKWISRIGELCDLGVSKVWFYVHQPGENRERILGFFNNMIPQINQSLSLEIPLLKNYS